MIKKILSFSLILVVLMSNLGSSFPVYGMEGDGSAETPFLVSTAADIVDIANDLDAHYRLTNDIDLTGLVWEAIPGIFTGVLDGYIDGAPEPTYYIDGGFNSDEVDQIGALNQGGRYKIIGLTIDESADANHDPIGLFSQLGGQVKNIDFINVDIKGHDYVGTLAGNNKGNVTIENVSVSGSVAGTENVGGIMGGIYDTSNS